MKAAILGLGSTVLEFKAQKGVTTYGCNDIFRHHRVDLLVCIDQKKDFNKERLKIIEESTPNMFYSQLSEWGNSSNYTFKQIQFQSPRGSLLKLDDGKVCYAFCSPFVACVLAYLGGADEIITYGCDFTDHKTLSKPHKQVIVKRDFTNLFNEFKNRGVKLYVSSEKSFLAGFIPVKKY